jgi:hypothetical protein
VIVDMLRPAEPRCQATSHYENQRVRMGSDQGGRMGSDQAEWLMRLKIPSRKGRNLALKFTFWSGK